ACSGLKEVVPFPVATDGAPRASAEAEDRLAGFCCADGASCSAFPLADECPRLVRRAGGAATAGRASLFTSPRSSCNCCCNNRVAGASCSQLCSARLPPVTEDQE